MLGPKEKGQLLYFLPVFYGEKVMLSVVIPGIISDYFFILFSFHFVNCY